MARIMNKDTYYQWLNVYAKFKLGFKINDLEIACESKLHSIKKLKCIEILICLETANKFAINIDIRCDGCFVFQDVCEKEALRLASTYHKSREPLTCVQADLLRTSLSYSLFRTANKSLACRHGFTR